MRISALLCPHFSAVPSAVQPRRATLAFLIVRVGCQKCFGVTGGAPQVNSGSPSRLVCRYAYRCKPIQKPFKGAYHIAGGEPCVYDYPSSEGSDRDKKETFYEYKIYLDV